MCGRENYYFLPMLVLATALFSSVAGNYLSVLRQAKFFGGVFDRFPKATLILGHMGESLPYQLWRLDSRSQQILDNLLAQRKGVPMIFARRSRSTNPKLRTVP
jgi:predicted TIM-barrel fold metal-dependent hydrolase